MPQKKLLVAWLQRFYSPIFLLVALVAYFWGLGGVQIPKIGDEVLYLQIARVTAESGHWLPLRFEEGVFSTKPPLLYWMGIVSSNWARDYTLLNMRLPVVFITLLGAALVYLLARKRTNNRKTATWGTAAYLGFMSTYQHGRPFLVNSFEVLFLFGPLVLYFYRRRVDFVLGLACALSWGAVAWSKSFALIWVGVLSLAAAILCLEWPARDKSKSTRSVYKLLIYLGAAAVVAHLIFSLWFYFDPDPKLLFNQFVIGENAIKFRGYHNYFGGLFTGIYPFYRIWLGPFANAGLFATLLLGLLVFFFKNRAALFFSSAKDNDFKRGTRALLAFILSFLVFYTLPTQRQENYLLPAMAALAVLLAENKNVIGLNFWKVSAIFAGLAFVLLSAAPLIIGTWKDMGLVAQILWGIGILLFATIVTSGLIAEFFPVAVLLCFVQLTNFSAPFNQGFKPLSETAKVDVWVPSHKLAQHERFRFLAPGTTPRAYISEKALVDLCARSPAGTYVVVEDTNAELCHRRFTQVDEIKDFRTRQKFSEILQIAAGHEEFLIRPLKMLRLE